MGSEVVELVWDKSLKKQSNSLLKQKPSLYVSLGEKLEIKTGDRLLTIEINENSIEKDGVNIGDLFSLIQYDVTRWEPCHGRGGEHARCKLCGQVQEMWLAPSSTCKQCGAGSANLEVVSRHVDRDVTYHPDQEEEDWLAECVIRAAAHALPRGTSYRGQEIVSNAEESADTAGYGFVYFIRNEELFKIGITVDLLRRFSEISPHEVLNVVRCQNFNELERRLHKHFSKKRLPQSEYFRLEPGEVLEAHRLLTDWAEF